MKKCLLAVLLLAVLFVLSGCTVYVGGTTADPANGVLAAVYDEQKQELIVPVVVTWDPARVRDDTVKIDEIDLWYGITEKERNALKSDYDKDITPSQGRYQAIIQYPNYSVSKEAGRAEFAVSIPEIHADDTITFCALVNPNSLLPGESNLMEELQVGKLERLKTNIELTIDMPETGDSSHIMPFIFLLTMSALALCILSLRRSRE